MRDLLQIVEGVETLRAQGRDAALATVMAVEGSSYRRPGARMLVSPDGRTWGTVSGGCLERDVARRARMLIAERGKPQLISYETDEDDIGEEAAIPVSDPGPSLGCGGRIEILIEHVAINEAKSLCVLNALEHVIRDRGNAIIATVFRVGSAPTDCPVMVGAHGVRFDDGKKMVRSADPTIVNDHAGLPANLLDLMLIDVRGSQRDRRIDLPGGGWADLLIEHLQPPQALVIFGDGHDVAPLVDLAKSLAWHVTVVGRRAAAGLAAAFLRADRVVFASTENPFGDLVLEPHAAAVVMGHNLRRDATVLCELLKQAPAYIGVLGPRRRTERLLAMSPGSRVELDHRLYSPVGLDIGAETPEQIALSIVAEIQAVGTGRPGASLRGRAGPIHVVGSIPDDPTLGDSLEEVVQR